MPEIKRIGSYSVKKTLLVLLMVLSSSQIHANNAKISSYDELLSAVSTGRDVKVIINFENCTTVSKDLKLATPIFGVLYRMNFDLFGYDQVVDENGEKHYAVIHSISGYTEHPTLGPVLTYSRMRVYDNNKINIHNALYNPKSYEKILNVDYNCHIGSDSKSIEFWAN